MFEFGGKFPRNFCYQWVILSLLHPLIFLNLLLIIVLVDKIIQSNAHVDQSLLKKNNWDLTEKLSSNIEKAGALSLLVIAVSYCV